MLPIIADTVIHLWRERVTQRTPIAPETTVDWKHDLLFCQVLKGRGLPIQRRTSCYEFVKAGAWPTGGIKFFPTYAAQGFVSLFSENQPQLEVIHYLRTVDVGSSYPGVVVQEFTRSALQRMFAVRRHTDKIPMRHPLMLANVDEYWVAELRKSNLLHAIPPADLKLYTLPLAECRTAPPSDSDAAATPTTTRTTARVALPTVGTSVIWELARKERFYREDLPNEKPENRGYLAVPQMANVGILVYRKDLLELIGRNAPPKTWEELEEICSVLRDRRYPYKILLETQTYDTLMMTALELGWGHGFFWRTKKSYNTGAQLEICLDEESRFEYFVDALTRLHRLIHQDCFVPKHCSVDPDNYKATDWAFARHWYSTWVDVLTRTDRLGQRLIKFGDRCEFGIAKLPISQCYKDRKGLDARHHSGWGEWYLAIQKGSENVELGVDLINNLMSSRKVTEMALSGAALPVVEKFYEAYGEAICFGTDLTFNRMRDEFFRDAKSRIDFEEYTRVARVLAGPLHAIVTNPRIGEPDQPTVKDLLLRAFEELQGFRFDPNSASS
jgi:hypothetical protein